MAYNNKCDRTLCKIRKGGYDIMRKFISDLRKKKHISMQKLANTLHISESTVCKVEAGTRNPSPAVAKRWAVYLGIPESKIFKYFFDV